MIQYKTLILRVGFDEKKHGYINPYQDMIEDNVPEYDVDNEDTNRFNFIPPIRQIMMLVYVIFYFKLKMIEN